MQAAPPPRLNLRRLESIQRVLRYLAAAVLVVFVALIAYAVYELRQINSEIAGKQAEAGRLGEEIEAKKKVIEAQKKEIEAQTSAFQNTFVPGRVLSAEQAKEVQQTVEENLGGIANARQLPPRVYIQFARAEQAEGAASLARQLQSRGFLTPGISQARAGAPRVSQLRYYQTDEVTQADLKNLTEFLRGARVRLGDPVLVKDAGGVRPRHYDLALGSDFGRDVETRPTPDREPTPEPARSPTPGPVTEPTRKKTPDRGTDVPTVITRKPPRKPD